MAKTKASILVIDDDKDVLTSARLLLKQHFTEVTTESDPRKIKDFLNTGETDVFLLDMNFRRGDDDGRAGLYWLEMIRTHSPDAVVILMTAFGQVDLAVKAMKAGASDFILKPWANTRMVESVTNAVRFGSAKKKLGPKKENPSPKKSSASRSFIGNAESLKPLFEVIGKVAPTDANVLVLGENGTGKELIAREIHQRSKRADKPFVAVDLGAIPDTLFESELFGHKKGAFTDAHSDRIGRFEMAKGGTLFLDELGNLPLQHQAKLLSALQERRIIPIGSSTPVPIDVRLISATNVPLYEMVSAGSFRQDLLYRVNTVELRLPPLRDRKEDIRPLAEYFIRRYGERYEKEISGIEASAIDLLEGYPWPGNVRELEHAMERAVIMTEKAVITSGDIRLHPKLDNNPIGTIENLDLESNERQLILTAFERHAGNISKMARDLGITRAALYRRMEKHGIK